MSYYIPSIQKEYIGYGDDENDIFGGMISGGYESFLGGLGAIEIESEDGDMDTDENSDDEKSDSKSQDEYKSDKKSDTLSIHSEESFSDKISESSSDEDVIEKLQKRKKHHKKEKKPNTEDDSEFAINKDILEKDPDLDEEIEDEDDVVDAEDDLERGERQQGDPDLRVGEKFHGAGVSRPPWGRSTQAGLENGRKNSGGAEGPGC